MNNKLNILTKVIAAGSKKLANVSFGRLRYVDWLLKSFILGGGSGASAAPAKVAEVKKEAVKEEKQPEPKKEEEADVGLGGGLFGDDEDF